MDNIDKILIQIGIDTKTLEKEKQDAILKLRDLVAKSNQVARGSGQAFSKAGSDAGELFNRSFERRLNSLSYILRRYFGNIGNVIAGGLDTLSRLDRGRFLAPLLGAGGGTAVGAAAGKSLTATDIGAGVAGGVVIAGGGKKSWPYLMAAAGTLKRLEKESKILKLLETDGINIAAALTRRENAIKVLKDNLASPKGMLARAITYLITSAAAGVVAGIMGGVAVGVGSVFAMSKYTKSQRAKAAEYGLTGGVYSQLDKDTDTLSTIKNFGGAAKLKEFVSRINDIKDVSKKTAEILKALGDDGLEKFEKLTQATKKLEEAQKNTNYAFEGFKTTMSILSDLISDAGTNITSFLYSYSTIGRTINSIKVLGNGLLELVGIGSKLQKGMDESAQGLADMEAKKIVWQKARYEADKIAAKQKEADDKAQLDYANKKEAAELDMLTLSEKLKALQDKKSFIEDENRVNQTLEDELEIKKQLLEIDTQIAKTTKDLSDKKQNAVEQQTEFNRRRLDIQSDMADEGKLTIDQLADLDPSKLPTLMRLPGGNVMRAPINRELLNNIQTARNVKYLEEWSQRALASNRPDLAARFTAQANAMKLSGKNILKASESNPMLRFNLQLEALKAQEKELWKKYAEETGINVNPKMATRR